MRDIHEKLLRSEFPRLPQPVRDAFLSAPVLSLPVMPAGDTFVLADVLAADRPAQDALIPKLGIKSWQSGGALGVIYRGVSMRAVLTTLLRAPTRAQKLAARAWTATGTPLHVHLSPYVDFSDVSEARYLVRSGTCTRTSACLRGASAGLMDASCAALAGYAADVAVHLDAGIWIIELAMRPDGAIRVVEVNPGLTPKELAAIGG